MLGYPGLVEIRELLAEQTTWSEKRKTLSPADRAGVDAVTTECTQALERLRGGR